MLNVTRGQLVPYTITVHNQFEIALPDVTIVDRYPAGFVYVEGSARLDGVPVEPTAVGRELTERPHAVGLRRAQAAAAARRRRGGVSEGEFVNRAQVVHS